MLRRLPYTIVFYTLVSLCNALGISIDQEFWEGWLISGQFVTWVFPGQIRGEENWEGNP
jgi:hypothetical protein